MAEAGLSTASALRFGWTFLVAVVMQPPASATVSSQNSLLHVRETESSAKVYLFVWPDRF